MDVSRDLQKTLSYGWLTRSWRSVWVINTIVDYLDSSWSVTPPWVWRTVFLGWLSESDPVIASQTTHTNVLDNVKTSKLSCCPHFRTSIHPVVCDSRDHLTVVSMYLCILSLYITSSVRFHSSHPYVKNDTTVTMYRRTLNHGPSAGESCMWPNFTSSRHGSWYPR